MPNVELLRRTLARIEANPEGLEQATWRRPGGMCFLSHAAQLAGGTWLTDPDDPLRAHLLIADGDDPAGRLEFVGGVAAVCASARGARVLGLTSSEALALSAPDNTVADLRRIVAGLCEAVNTNA